MTGTITLPPGVTSPVLHAAAMSDAKSSELVEAVHALNMVTAPTTPKRPLAAPIQVGGLEEVDSGYASKSSTPENSNFGTFDVANTPLSSLIRRKKTRLTHFEKSIPKLTQNRFQDLRELYADSLNNLASGVSKRRGILMTLKVLGENEEAAVPWVFVQCDKAIAKKVRRFFKQASVASDFKPLTPTIYTPKLDVYVHELPPLLLGENLLRSPKPADLFPRLLDPTMVYYQRDPKFLNSLCGTRIFAAVDGEWRSATIGGVISLETAEGYVQEYGITAGHFINDEGTYVGRVNEEAEDEEEDTEEDSDEDTDDELFGDGQYFELDLNSLEKPPSLTPVAENLERSTTPDGSSSPIGKVIWTSQKNLQDQPNLDWALFSITDTSLVLPNIVMSDEVTQAGVEDVQELRSVVLSTASGGKIHGTLSSSWSYLSLAPGSGLVRTKAVKINESRALAPGDSGAWVVDSISNQLYGHVVASDVFGVSYIVPISDVFKDIELRLPFQTVKLPSRTLPIIGAKLSRTKTPSQEHRSETLSSALKVIDSCRCGFEGCQVENVSVHSSRPLSISWRHNAHSSEPSETQQDITSNDPAPRHTSTFIATPESAMKAPISVPEAAHLNARGNRSSWVDQLSQRQMIRRKPVPVSERDAATSASMVNVIPDSTVSRSPESPNTSKSDDIQGGFGFFMGPIAVDSVNSDFIKGPARTDRHWNHAAKIITPSAPISNDNALLRALRKLGMRRKGSKDSHASGAKGTMNIVDQMAPRSPVANQSEIPADLFSDSGYSTMVNSPGSSKLPTPQPSPHNSAPPSPEY